MELEGAGSSDPNRSDESLASSAASETADVVKETDGVGHVGRADQ